MLAGENISSLSVFPAYAWLVKAAVRASGRGVVPQADPPRDGSMWRPIIRRRSRFALRDGATRVTENLRSSAQIGLRRSGA